MVVFDAVVQVIEPEQGRDGRPDEELSTQGEVRTNVNSGIITGQSVSPTRNSAKIEDPHFLLKIIVQFVLPQGMQLFLAKKQVAPSQTSVDLI